VDELDGLSGVYFSKMARGVDAVRRNASGLYRMNAQLIAAPEERQSQRERRVPRHIGFIPDGNRRWAVQNGLPKEQGYENGIAPGVALFEACKTLGIEEVSVFGFTQDNTRRPTAQANHFRAALGQCRDVRSGRSKLRCVAELAKEMENGSVAIGRVSMRAPSNARCKCQWMFSLKVLHQIFPTALLMHRIDSHYLSSQWTSLIRRAIGERFARR
jgi:hypothetical protein